MAVRRTGLCLLFLLLVSRSASAGAPEVITVGTVPNLGDGAMLCAMERGYFTAGNLDVRLTNFATASLMTPLIARGDLTMIRGGVNVSYFNSIARGLPMKYFANGSLAPVYHALVMRPGLQESVKSARDLKGLRIGITAIGGLSEYELGKTLLSVGLSLDDVETRPLGMAETVTAVSHGALDGADFVPPFDIEAIKAGGWELLKTDAAVVPRMEVSGIVVNTDWVAAHEDALVRFTVGYIRGARCFAEAAAGGPNREEMIDAYVKYDPVKDRAVYRAVKWPGINPDGRVAIESLMDQQAFYVKRGYLKAVLPAEKIVDTGPVEKALARLRDGK